MRNHDLSEQCAVETLINSYLVKDRAIYRLNERSVSNLTGDIIFSTRSSGRLRQQTSRKRDLPTRAKHRTFP